MTFGDKQVGRCLACQTDLYEILEVFPVDHPLAGHPRRLGRARDAGTQVRFLLTTGTTADVAFCRACADALTPADYWPAWQACVTRMDVALTMAGRSDTVRRAERAQGLAVWPLAVVGRRWASPDGLAMLDRR